MADNVQFLLAFVMRVQSRKTKKYTPLTFEHIRQYMLPGNPVDPAELSKMNEAVAMIIAEAGLKFDDERGYYY